MSAILKEIDVSHFFCLLNVFFSISFHFTPVFCLGRVADAPDLTCPELTHGLQQPQIVLLAPHHDVTKQGRRCGYSTWSLDDLWVAFPWMWPARPTMQIFSWGILITQSRRWIIVAEAYSEMWLDIQDFTNFTAQRFVAKCHAVKFFATISFLQLVFEIMFFQSIPKTHVHRWESKQRPI